MDSLPTSSPFSTRGNKTSAPVGTQEGGRYCRSGVETPSRLVPRLYICRVPADGVRWTDRRAPGHRHDAIPRSSARSWSPLHLGDPLRSAAPRRIGLVVDSRPTLWCGPVSASSRSCSSRRAFRAARTLFWRLFAVNLLGRPRHDPALLVLRLGHVAAVALTARPVWSLTEVISSSGLAPGRTIASSANRRRADGACDFFQPEIPPQGFGLATDLSLSTSLRPVSPIPRRSFCMSPISRQVRLAEGERFSRAAPGPIVYPLAYCPVFLRSDVNAGPDQDRPPP